MTLSYERAYVTGFIKECVNKLICHALSDRNDRSLNVFKGNPSPNDALQNHKNVIRAQVGLIHHGMFGQNE